MQRASVELNEKHWLILKNRLLPAVLGYLIGKLVLSALASVYLTSDIVMQMSFFVEQF